MISANELRIGNYIWLKSHHYPVQIEQIFKENDCFWVETDLHEGEKLKIYSPIPLTEDWLIKFGFEKRNNAWVIKNDTKIYNLDGFQFSIWKDLTYNTGEITPPLQYVHQLQNLYFALTGEELTLKSNL